MNQQKIGRTEKWIKIEIINTLQTKVKSSILKVVSIVDVKVSRDLSYATVFWTVYDEPNVDEITKISHELEKVKGFCRKQLANISSSYTVPQLNFKFDDTESKAAKINAILAQIKTKSSDEE